MKSNKVIWLKFEFLHCPTSYLSLWFSLYLPCWTELNINNGFIILLTTQFKDSIQVPINPSGAKTGTFWNNLVNTITVDVLVPCIARLSAAMLLIMWINGSLSPTWYGFNYLHIFSVEKLNSFVFLQKNSASYGLNIGGSKISKQPFILVASLWIIMPLISLVNLLFELLLMLNKVLLESSHWH